MNRLLLIGGAVVVAVLLIGGAAVFALSNQLGESAGGDVHAGPGGPDAVHVVMHDNTFEPASIEVKAGQTVAIEVRNDGAADHNFTNEALKLSTGPVKPGEVVTAKVTAPAGTTQFKCTWHQGMVIDVVGS